MAAYNIYLIFIIYILSVTHVLLKVNIYLQFIIRHLSEVTVIILSRKVNLYFTIFYRS